MSEDEIYLTDVGFIPKGGKLFVDRSGIEFVGPFRDYKYVNWRKIERAKNCLKLFRKRGDVFTTKGVLSELIVKVNIYREKKKNVKNNKKHNNPGINMRHLSNPRGEIMKRAKRNLKIYKNLYDYLEESSKKVNLGSEDEKKEIYSFVHRYDKKSLLSEVDKELLFAAIYSGDSGGIFTADVPMISTYHAAVDYFSLKDCFIADAIGSTTRWI